ncbi:cysteine proteinase inhibitor 1-like [Wolffia australiana]
MKTLAAPFLLLAIISAAALQANAAIHAGSTDAPTPGWTRIRTVEDYNYALRVARFAVAAHNKEAGEKLEFVRMYRGYVDGQYYQLFIQAKDKLVNRKYETVIFENVPSKVLELVFFRRSA